MTFIEPPNALNVRKTLPKPLNNLQRKTSEHYFFQTLDLHSDVKKKCPKNVKKNQTSIQKCIKNGTKTRLSEDIG